MAKRGVPVVMIAFFVIIIARNNHRDKNDWEDLFNGKNLAGWDVYLGPSFDSAGKQNDDALGLGNDPQKVFTVLEEDGKPAIRISGERFGGISTQKEFRNYHLKLEFKWGQLKWAPRKNSKRDSGLLYHAGGPHGADFGYWMRSQEFQVQEGDCGDYWGVAGGMFDIPAIKNEKGNWLYDEKGKVLTFSDKSDQGRWCIKTPDSEKKSGEWNTLELICLGDTAIHIVNDKVVMRLYKSRMLSDGKQSALKEGKIQIQCEGAEVFYREIKITNIKSIPKKFL